MRYAVLSWDSLSLRERRCSEPYGSFDDALAARDRLSDNPRVRLAVVMVIPEGRDRQPQKMILPEEAPYTIPRWLTGNAPRGGSDAPRPKCHGCGRPLHKRTA